MLSVAGGGDWGHYPGPRVSVGPTVPVSLASWAEQGPGAGSFVTRGNTETRAGGGGVTSHVTPRDSAHLGRYGTVVL